MRIRALVLISLFVAAPTAHAQVAVVESHVGERDPEAARLLSPILFELRTLGYVTAPDDLGARIEARVSRPGLPLPATELASARRAIDSGWDAWLSGRYRDAIDELSGGLATLRARPATLAEDATLADATIKALVGLAMAYARSGDVAKATEHMADVIRGDPDRPFNRAAFGPEAHDLYKRVRRDLDASPRGTLKVDVDDPDVVVFLDERYQGLGSLRKDDLYPGRHRVFVRKGSAPGRVHDVDVPAGGAETVSISWRLDRALTSGPDFVGLVFDTDAERRQLEGVYAPTIARAVGASGVVILAVTRYQGRRSLVGAVLSLDTGKAQRTGILALEPSLPGVEQARALARFLAGGEPAQGVIVPEPEQPRTASTRGILMTGLGVAALAAGITLVALHEPEIEDGVRNPDARDTIVPGAILAGVGAAAIGLGIYFWVTDGKRTGETVSIAPVAGGGIALTIGVEF